MHGYNSFYRHANGVSLEQTAILFRPDGSRDVKEVETYEFDEGGHWGGVSFRVLMLWKMDPEGLFNLKNDEALPWAMFMRKSEDSLRRMFARVRRLTEVNMAAAGKIKSTIAWFGGLRYDWNDSEKEILGDIAMYIKDEVMRESTYYQHVIGLGRQEGKAQGMMDSLRLVLTANYPGLENTPGLSALAGPPAVVASLLRDVVTAKDRPAAESAIRAALRESALS